MKIPQWVYDDFYIFDKNRDGIIKQDEIDLLKGTGSIYDTSDKYCLFKVSDKMDISLFIKENKVFYDGAVQFTNNEYKEGRKILQNNQLILTDEARKICKDNLNSIQVKQGEFVTKTYSKASPSLKTYNICSCVAVTIHDKAIKRGFLAHIDTADKARDLERILKMYNFNPKTSEVRIIGGYTDYSNGTIEIIDETVNKFNLKVVEYDILGRERRNILLDLKTGEVFDYEESENKFDDESPVNRSLKPNKQSE